MHGEDNEYYDLKDMPPCRACNVAPVLKGNPTANGCGNTRLQCPECGIRTGMSTNDQGNYRVWVILMGGGAAKTAEFASHTPGCSCKGITEALKALTRYRDKAIQAECLRKVAAGGCNCDRGYMEYCDEVIRWADA